MGRLFFCCSPCNNNKKKRPRKKKVTKEVVEITDEAKEKRNGDEDLRWEVAGFDVL